MRQNLASSQCYIYDGCSINKSIYSHSTSDRFITLINKGYGICVKWQIINYETPVCTGSHRLSFTYAHLNTCLWSITVLGIKNYTCDFGSSIFHSCIDQGNTFVIACWRNRNTKGLIISLTKGDNIFLY